MTLGFIHGQMTMNAEEVMLLFKNKQDLYTHYKMAKTY